MEGDEESKPLGKTPSSCKESNGGSPLWAVVSRALVSVSWRTWASATVFFSFILVIILSGAIVSGFDVVVFTARLSSFFTSINGGASSSSSGRGSAEYHLSCSPTANATNPQNCPAGYYPSKPIEPDTEYTTACPEYFRLVVYKGKAYLEQFHRAWQTRGVFTLWGILQLLRLYPGSVPDLEMMFCCEDLPALPKRNNQVPEGAAPSAMFHYCGEESAFDIPFPDWSFWGWIGLFLE
ncbi:hypothetical protein SAY87_013419 [Trapa incisa]|uniref:Glycosyl transferase CAP10 domain-containing protein n=1 Tax=Trapa incisa TaxID=236973 RepID=A0AAN7QCX8_9MYRT|nr:hypothetical protein SAY87_013419 [Trapa incisa]